MDNNIEIDNMILLERYKQFPPHPSYIAGFIDGDGCIFIRKIKDGYQSGITIAQSRTNILQIIRYHFGGSITTSSKRNNCIENTIDESNKFYYKNNRRNQYNLVIRSNEYNKLLEYIKDTIVIKKRELDCVCKMEKFTHIINKKEEKETLYKICSERINNHMENSDKINIEYIQGLFDAEGCFYIDKTSITKFYIKLSQKNNPYVLHKIQSLLQCGEIHKDIYLIIFNKEDCLRFTILMKPGLIVKYKQACAMETFLQTNDIDKKKEMYRICNEEKHRVEQFNELNQNDIGKEGYLQRIALMETHRLAFQEIRKIKQYQEKSEKMIGESNHNYGKSKSEEVKKKMSIAHKLNKGISDDVILKVRALLDKGHKNVDIEKELDVGRHIVTRIKNGELVCINEEKKSSNKMTVEEQAISKRKIEMEEICLIIDKCIDEWKPASILKLLQENREKQNQDINVVTIDIVKNIKRKISEKKCPLYPSEERYNEYMEKIQNQ
jgi:hypothetical protein